MDVNTQAVREQVEGALKKGQKALSEYASKRVLEAYGVPVVDEALVQSAPDAVTAAERFGYPVAVKACGPTLTHKTDQGLVALDLDQSEAVEEALTTLQTSLGDMPFEGFLVQPMVRAKREVIVGGLRDPLFGPCVMLGVGGIMVEATKDVAFRLAPLEERDALEMMYELKAHRLFDAVRGEPAVDREALCRVLQAVGQLLVDFEAIEQVDVNPLLFAEGRPIAVDGLVVIRGSGDQGPGTGDRGSTARES